MIIRRALTVIIANRSEKVEDVVCIIHGNRIPIAIVTEVCCLLSSVLCDRKHTRATPRTRISNSRKPKIGRRKWIITINDRHLLFRMLAGYRCGDVYLWVCVCHRISKYSKLTASPNSRHITFNFRVSFFRFESWTTDRQTDIAAHFQCASPQPHCPRVVQWLTLISMPWIGSPVNHHQIENVYEKCKQQVSIKSINIWNEYPPNLGLNKVDGLRDGAGIPCMKSDNCSLCVWMRL